MGCGVKCPNDSTPSGETHRANPASQGPIRMHPTPAFAEKAAIAIFLRSQDRAASLGMAFDELRRRKVEVPR